MVGPFALQADDGDAEGTVKGPQAKPTGLALDCPPHRRKNRARFNKAKGLKSLARKGTFLLGQRRGHFYCLLTLGLTTD